MNENTYDMEVFSNKELTSVVRNVNKQEIRKYKEKDEIVEIINRIPAGKQKMVIIFLWYTGLRATEVLYLKKGDIDFENKTIRIQWLKSRKVKERIVPIKPQLCTMLQFYSTGMTNKDRLFPHSRQWLFKIVQKWFKDSPHMLRHSFAVNFLRQSKSPTALVVLQRLLGHGRVQTTMEYLKIVPMDMAIELEKVSFE